MILRKGIQRTLLAEIVVPINHPQKHATTFISYAAYEPLSFHIDIPGWGKWEVCRTTARLGVQGRMPFLDEMCVFFSWDSFQKTLLSLRLYGPQADQHGEWLITRFQTSELRMFMSQAYSLVPEGEEVVDLSDADFMAAKWAAEAS